MTWLGHACFRIEACGNVVIIDPFLTGNALFTGDPVAATEGCTHIVLTHGHDDHVGDTVEIANRTGATVIAGFELANYLADKGVAKLEPCNPGGTIYGYGVDVTFTKAFHSSSTRDEAGNTIYLGAACGVIVQGEGRTVYHMGDTEIFGDMALINEVFAPEVGLVPIGDRFTMGAKQAAMACKRYFDFKTIVPMHYGTFPIIDQEPSKFVMEMGDDVRKVFVPEMGLPFTV